MKLQHQLLIGYASVMAVLAGVAVLSYRVINTLNESNHWVAHTHKVIAKISHVEKLVIDMETGQRGFLVAGEDVFLDPYNAAFGEYKIQLDELKQTVSDNPAQVDKLEIIVSLIDEWIERAAKPEIMERRKAESGAIDAMYLQEILAAGQGKNILDQMRSIMDEMIVRFKIDGNVKGEALTEWVAKAMVDQETGERGFIITGKDSFLEPFHNR